LQQDLPRCVVVQIFTPHDVAHTLFGIVYDYGELVSPQAISTFENKVANFFRHVLLLEPHSSVMPFQSLGQVQSIDDSLHMEPPCTRGFAIESIAASTWINRRGMSC
jgi:hypothetical protein